MAASSLVLDEAMNGNLEIKGRRPDGIAYEPIPERDVAASAFLRVDADRRVFWRTKPAPRDGVDPKRIQTLLDYDSLTVRSEQFERIWRRDDPETDRVRKELLKKAAAAALVRMKSRPSPKAFSSGGTTSRLRRGGRVEHDNGLKFRPTPTSVPRGALLANALAFLGHYDVLCHQRQLFASGCGSTSFRVSRTSHAIWRIDVEPFPERRITRF